MALTRRKVKSERDCCEMLLRVYIDSSDCLLGTSSSRCSNAINFPLRFIAERRPVNFYFRLSWNYTAEYLNCNKVLIFHSVAEVTFRDESINLLRTFEIDKEIQSYKKTGTAYSSLCDGENWVRNSIDEFLQEITNETS